ncbi:MAG: hypothetical protein K9M12_02085 [Candidatus Pacebacteria bacterium]|nr:hypothetical protein [Candidatus Paceibacterota bacterium]
MFNYKNICEELMAVLPERTKDIISRRFGLFGKKRETLEAVGKSHGITRERVRQIERDGIRRIKKSADKYSDVLAFLRNKMEEFGGIRKEDVFLEELSKNNDEKNYIVFLLNIDEKFSRIYESPKRYVVWVTDKERLDNAEKIIKEICSIFEKEKKLLSVEEIKEKLEEEISLNQLLFIIETSKEIGKSKNGKLGLYKWPDVNPKGIRDKVYLALKEAKKPLHFKEIASSLEGKSNPQTTHNELIKDPSFVLVGRGVYALAEWGYVPGEVKEVIRKILKKEGALYKDEIITHVAKQRIVKKNTIIQNLSNKKYFIRTPDGKYTIA